MDSRRLCLTPLSTTYTEELPEVQLTQPLRLSRTKLLTNFHTTGRDATPKTWDSVGPVFGESVRSIYELDDFLRLVMLVQ